MPSPSLRHRISAIVIAAAGGTLHPGSAYAQEPERPAPAPGATLDDVVVTAPRVVPYKAESAQLNRLGLSLAETPSSLSVVTQEVIQSQNVEALGDVLRNVAGVRTSEFFGAYQGVYSRGFFLSNYLSYTRDGLRFAHFLPPPRRSIDRYEVIKGAGALDFGQVSAGGLINYVSKRPGTEFDGMFDASVGTDGYRSAGLDLTGPLGDRFAFRVTGAYTEDFARTSRLDPQQEDFTATLRFRPTDSTVIDLDYEYLKGESVSDPGFPILPGEDIEALDRFDREAFYGEGQRFPRSTKLGSVRWFQSFGDDWLLRAAYQNAVTTRTARVTAFDTFDFDGDGDGYDPTTETVDRYLIVADGQRIETDMVQLDLRGTLRFGDVSHRLMVGVDYLKVNEDVPVFDFYALDPVNLRNPVAPTGVAPALLFGFPYKTDFDDVGVTLQDHVTFGRFSALLGLRYDRASETDQVTGRDVRENVVSPSASFAYAFTPAVRGYLTYAESFEPNFSVYLAGDRIAPASIGELYEAGVKSELNGGNLLLTVAAYQLTKSSVPTDDLLNPGYSVLSGEQRSRGVEVELVGRLTDGLDVVASVSQGEAEVTRDSDPSIVGNRLDSFPETSASLWVTWSPQRVEGLALSIGAFHNGTRAISIFDAQEYPSYTVVDAAASYQFDWLGGAGIQLNVRNLFDRRYYETGNGNGEVQAGLGRRASVSAFVKF